MVLEKKSSDSSHFKMLIFRLFGEITVKFTKMNPQCFTFDRQKLDKMKYFGFIFREL